MYDDYDDDFEEIEDVTHTKQQNKQNAPKPNTNNRFQAKPMVSKPLVNRVNDDVDDYDDFEDEKPSNSKPAAGKPDWLKSSKPAAAANKPPAKNPLNPFNKSAPRKAEAISENRTSARREFDKPAPNAVVSNAYGAKGSDSKKQKPVKKRDFSVDHDIPKAKKINLPKDYLDKYTKNNPVRDLENSMKEIKENIRRLQQELEESKNISNDQKRQKTLQRINKDLRGELKKLSENSTTLCDELQKRHYKKKKTPRKIDGETELKIKDREIENADKQMSNLLTEYNAVKKRIEQVGDYNYAVELKSKVQENEQKIKDNEKLIKEMEQDQKRRDIQMNRLVKEEKTEKMRRVDYKHSKLTYLHEKISDLESKIQTLEQVQKEQDEQETEITQKYEAMLRIGEHYGITEKNIDNEEQIFKNKILDEYEQVARKEKHIKSEIESIEKQYKVEMKEKKKMIKEYTDKKKAATKELGQVVKDILTKAKQLDDLIEKMRGFGMGEDILNKWAEENKELIRNNEAY